MKKITRNQTPPKSIIDDLRKEIEQMEKSEYREDFEIYLTMLKEDLKNRIEPMYRQRLKEIEDDV